MIWQFDKRHIIYIIKYYILIYLNRCKNIETKLKCILITFYKSKN